MSDMPRVPRGRKSSVGSVERGVAAFGCFALLCWAAFWGTVIYVIAHFVLKYW